MKVITSGLVNEPDSTIFLSYTTIILSSITRLKHPITFIYTLMVLLSDTRFDDRHPLQTAAVSRPEMSPCGNLPATPPEVLRAPHLVRAE